MEPNNVGGINLSSVAPSFSSIGSNVPALSLEGLKLNEMDFLRSQVNIRNKQPLHFLYKLDKYRRLFPPNHIIDVNLYDTVFVTSDTHADFRKLVQILSLSNLIRLPLIDGRELDPYTDDIYSTELLCATKWIPDRTLFIIVGDLVDGCRNCDTDHREPKMKVNDPVGSFEYLLHCFLYNLRLDAIQKGSNVLFTIGNHDMHSVILNYGISVENYVHAEAWSYFGRTPGYSPEADRLRRQALKPFYDIHPYVFLSLENAGKKEVGFVHGGFHETNGDNLLPLTLGIQKVINTEGITPDLWNMSGGPLWTRSYQDGWSAERCDLLDDLNYSLIVVGHCPTNYIAFPTFHELYTKMGMIDSDCTSSDGKGCVLLDCERVAGSPRLAHVDTASSQCFRTPGKFNQLRPVEILKLSKRDGVEATYYNVEKVELTPPNPTGVIQTPGPPGINFERNLDGPDTYKAAYYYNLASNEAREAYRSCKKRDRLRKSGSTTGFNIRGKLYKSLGMLENCNNHLLPDYNTKAGPESKYFDPKYFKGGRTTRKHKIRKTRRSKK